MTSRRVVFTSPGLEKNSPGLVKPYTAGWQADGWTLGNSRIICKILQINNITLLVMNNVFRTYTHLYIRYKIPEKVFTRSQMAPKQLIISALRCEGLGFSSLHTHHRPFTPAVAMKRR